MNLVGYAYLVKALGLAVRKPARSAQLSTSVNRRVDNADSILFPTSAALNNTPLGHLEFALRHEKLDLAIVTTALQQIGPREIVSRLQENPNGEYIRKAAFYWEWTTDRQLPTTITPTGRYINLLDPDAYVVAKNPIRNKRWRINDNLLGNPRFCPVITRSTNTPDDTWLQNQLSSASWLADATTDPELYQRAVQYLYLSETKSSFAIEKEIPSAAKEERFVQILHHAGSKEKITEDWLVEIQNIAINNPLLMEVSYRSVQNWLDNRQGRLTFLPHPPDELRATMVGWEEFVNDTERGIDPLTKAACASFGFVYIHPFNDGNGRIHRFIIHHILARSGLLPDDMILPVSAVIMKHIPNYNDVLKAFSVPVTNLWDYTRAERGGDPLVLKKADVAAYRFFSADHEHVFLAEMIKETVEKEIPNEISYLHGYGLSRDTIEAAYDIPQKDITKLIVMIHGNNGRLSNNKRNQFLYLTDEAISDIEHIIQESFSPKIPSTRATPSP